MVDIDVGMSDVSHTQEQFEAAAEASKGNANDALREFAEEVRDEFEETSPVDTGEYKSSWFIIEADDNLVYIVNSANHAKYLVFPNSHFMGNPGADVPSRGIYHNVRGIVHQKKSEWEASLLGKLRNKLI